MNRMKLRDIKRNEQTKLKGKMGNGQSVKKDVSHMQVFRVNEVGSNNLSFQNIHKINRKLHHK